MQCCKFKELLKTFHKICYYGQTIVVPIDVHFTYECIRLVCWTNITDDFVTTKKHDCCEIESVFPCCVIFGVSPALCINFLLADEAHKAQIRETQFPKDLEKAYELGKRLCSEGGGQYC